MITVSKTLNFNNNFSKTYDKIKSYTNIDFGNNKLALIYDDNRVFYNNEKLYYQCNNVACTNCNSCQDSNCYSCNNCYDNCHSCNDCTTCTGCNVCTGCTGSCHGCNTCDGTCYSCNSCHGTCTTACQGCNSSTSPPCNHSCSSGCAGVYCCTGNCYNGTGIGTCSDCRNVAGCVRCNEGLNPGTPRPGACDTTTRR